jgi:uncharacterized protein (DUF1697 family)
VARLVAFLRGINVSGHHLVRMAELVATFEKAGAPGSSSFKASGNVVFTWPSADVDGAARAIGRAVQSRHGEGIAVIVRTMEHLEELYRSNPFGSEVAEGDTPYVTFFARPPTGATPGRNARGDLDILSVEGAEAFSLARSIDGRPGFPNPFFERSTGLVATTRNWATVRGIVEKEREGAPPVVGARRGSVPRRTLRRRR